MFPPKKPAGPPKSMRDLRLGLQHASPDPDGDNDGSPVSCPSCGAALNLVPDKTGGGAAGPAGGSPELVGGGDEGQGGGL